MDEGYHLGKLSVGLMTGDHVKVKLVPTIRNADMNEIKALTSRSSRTLKVHQIFIP